MNQAFALSMLTLLALMVVGPRRALAAAPDFNRDVRPILAENCFKCHGPDADARQADIRFDVPGAVANLDSGDGHELLVRVTSADLSERMPPQKSGKSLTAAEIDMLTGWIESGANYTDHWSFVPPKRPQVPKVAGVTHPIDCFILPELRKRSLDYSPEADQVTLLRRLNFDLNGLPPSVDEVCAFLADDGSEAYERTVERLLESPHYGERMAIQWLDLVRYADTNGYHGDNYRSVWPYRDYVIRAFNENKPFDQFTIEQLAGDLLPNATREQRVASAYNRLNMITAEGGAQPKEYLAKYAADRVRTTSTAWLGVTLGCAECHDHKFDPFMTEDFYRFAAYFADLQERGLYGIGQWDPVLPLPSDEQAVSLAAIDEQIAAVEDRIGAGTEELTAEQADWELEVKARTRPADLEFQPLAPTKIKTAFGGEVVQLPDKSVLSQGKNHVNETYIVELQTDLSQITAIRLEALTHPTLTGGSLSRGNGNFVMTEFSVDLLDKGDDAPPRRVKIAKAEASYSAKGAPIEDALDPSAENGWIVDGHLYARDRQALFVFDQPIKGGPGRRLRIHIRHESVYFDHVMGRFRLSLTAFAEPAVLAENPVADDVLRAIHVDAKQRSPEQSKLVADYFRSLAPDLDKLREELKSLEDQRKKLSETIPTVLVSVSVEPRAMRILPRGNWMDESGPEVTPAPPAILAASRPDSERRESRLELAKWFVDGQNPLTARVFVNRLWKMLYGTGLSTTLDDFGAQGAPPRYADLLDWLAVEFVESGWDVKHMIRLMVTSTCYRQSSQLTPALAARDPQNELFARQQSFRLDAELVRDNALAVSGLLAREIGGPSVKPYQPAGYWAQLNFPVRKYERDTGDALYRRGLYTYWMRTFLHPSMRAFDAPSREECTVARPQSTTPLQALVLLNDPTYVEAARGLALRTIQQATGDPAERVVWAYEQVLSSVPSQPAGEVLLLTYYQNLRDYQSDPAAAESVGAVGELQTPDDVDPAELAAWTAVSRVLLNLHETITRY